MADFVGAVDQGTTSTRFMVFDHDGAEVGRHQLEHEQVMAQAGWVEHNPLEIWERTQTVIGSTLSHLNLQASDLSALGITNQRETTIVWNKRTGRPLHNAIVWQDTRTDKIARALDQSGQGDVIRERAGIPPAAYFSAGKVQWILDNVDGARAAAESGDAIFGTIDTWLIWNLTGGTDGGVHVTDVTNASRTMLMDLTTLDWDDELLGFFGIPRSMLPTIRPSSDPDFYGHTLTHGPLGGEVPIAGDLGDQHAATVGQVCFSPGEAKNTYGTGNFMLLNTGEEIVRSESGLLTTVAYQFGDAKPVYALEGSIAVTGSAVQWLRDQLGIISGAGDVERLAKSVDDTGGLYFVPAFSGLFAPYWRPDARGAIVGMSRFNTGAHLARATLEAICYQTRDVSDAMTKDSGVELEVLKVDGGVTANNLCMQLQSDILGVPVSRPVVAETTALGAAYAAGLATGFWSGTDELRANWQESQRWSPTWSDRQRTDGYAGWRKAVERTLDWVDVDEDQAMGFAGTDNALSPQGRERAIDVLSSGDELDLLVIGGGVVGSGTALDAVTRGLSTGLIEQRDFASGTSSRSSKLIHGGLRYLEMLDFTLVREALHERGLLLTRLAPHLVRPVPFLYPLTHHVWERAYVGSGIALYDAMAMSSGTGAGLPHHRHLTRRQALRLMPSLKSSALTGAVQYYDAQVDDARHTMELARTAASYGAQVANRVAAIGFLRQGERVTGVRAIDKLTDRVFEVNAKQIVNATGVWTDDTQAMVGERGQFHVRASKGIHLVVPRDRIHSSTGLILRTEKSVLFVIPWGRHWILGTTDTDWALDKAHPAATRVDIDYILDHVNRVLATPLTHEDVEGVYAGLRPLLAGESESTSKLSREHVVAHSAPGLVVVAGGKYTTYRVMAKDAVDEAAQAIPGRIAASTTDTIPLLGGVGYQAAWNQRQTLARTSGLHVARVEHLLRRYGSLTQELLDLIAEHPELKEPLDGAEDHLKAEVVYAASHEGALHLTDILTRRTRISIEAWDRGVSAAPAAAALVAPVLGWDEARTKEEVEIYLGRVEAERVSQTMQDDASADAARRSGPDGTL